MFRRKEREGGVKDLKRTLPLYIKSNGWMMFCGSIIVGGGGVVIVVFVLVSLKCIEGHTAEYFFPYVVLLLVVVVVWARETRSSVMGIARSDQLNYSNIILR